ncbi:ABC transporter permease [Haploplasma axanthum]|uniref:L-arabinose transporter permease protein n=1 Tax=Haploplasma axanthum TaxID=29552 RepID=A0A449BBE1_HAPAX|nr:ABC transporter permease [Haploplasma axanthum]VEU79715.1 L-arabinose transporter permease protein [Haploplasma axanthum]
MEKNDKKINDFILKTKKAVLNKKFLFVLMSIVTGILIGFIIMLIIKPASAFRGLSLLLTSGFRTPRAFGNVLFRATPLIVIGLAVGFGFKTGLFNIGASGQFMVGGIAALYVANIIKAPIVLHFIIAFIAAIIAGGLWGVIPGILKAKFNVNEVITTIMMNYIAVYLCVMLVYNPKVYDSGITAINTIYPTANVPRLGLNVIFPGSYIDMGILIAIGLAVISSIVLRKTTVGYELVAVGNSVDGSKYAGINVKKNIILAMAISGAIAGAAAALNYLPQNPDYFRPYADVNPIGFEGISVALIAQSSPIGTIFSGIFIAFIKQGALNMQFAGFDKEITNIIVAVIIYMIAISSFIGAYLMKRIEKKKKEKVIKKEELSHE